MNLRFYRSAVVLVFTLFVLTVLAVEDEPEAREAGRNRTSHTTWERNSNLNISTTADKSRSTTDVSIPTTEQDWSPFPPGDVLNNPWLRKIKFCVVLCFNETKLQGLRNLWPYLRPYTSVYSGEVYYWTRILDKAKEIAFNTTLRSKTYCTIVAYPIWEEWSVQCIPIRVFYEMWNYSPLGLLRDNIALSVFNATLAFLSLTLGIFGNILIIVAVMNKKELKTSTNLILVGMAVADCLNSVTIVFHEYLDTFLWNITNPVLGPIGCEILGSLKEFSQLVAVNHLITLSFERYFAICWPMKTNLKFTRKKTILVIVVNWLIAGAQLVPSIFLNIKLNNRTNYVGYTCRAGGTGPAWIFVVFNLTIYLGLPVPILCFNYICVVRSLLTSIKRSRQMTGDSSQQTNAGKARLKLIYMMITLVVIYVLTVAPGRILYTLYSYRVVMFKTGDGNQVFAATNLLRGMNSCTNVVVYALISRQFRTAFKDILCRCRRKTSGGHPGSGNQNGIEKKPAGTREGQV